MNTNTMIAEENEKLLTLFALKNLFAESEKLINEALGNTQLNFKTIGLVNEEKPIEFPNGLKLQYTKPKELSEKDYDEKIEKLKLETLQWEKKKQEFLEYGCVDLKSKPILKWQTTTNFNENVAKKQQELLEKYPLFAEIKNTVKQIEN